MNATWRQLIPRTLFMLLALASNSLSSEEFYEHGWTPVHFAVISGKGLEELLLTGADVNARDKEAGDTPLHLASEEGLVAAAKILLTNGALVTATNKFGFTPLHSAAHSDSPDTVELLLAKGAELEARDHEGLTPLAYAARWGRVDALRTLLKRGASVAAQDLSHRTLAELASLGLREVATDLVRVQQQFATTGDPDFTALVIRSYGSEAKWRESAGRYAKEKESLKLKYETIITLLGATRPATKPPEVQKEAQPKPDGEGKSAP
jgi:hypothetical protein